MLPRHLLSTALLLSTASSLAAQIPTYTLPGSAGSRLGWSVAGAGDVNGDTLDDIIVGAPQDDTAGVNAGKAVVISGADGSVLHTFLGLAAGDRLGRAVAGAGDVNGDGFDDLVVGAPGEATVGVQNGAAFVFSGADGSQLHVFRGQINDALGLSVAGAGDVDRDGYDDVIIGGPEGPTPVVGAGFAVIYSGASGNPLRFFLGKNLGDTFGYSVAGPGDIDGDGIPDLLVGAPQEVNGIGQRAGAAYVLSGADGSELRVFRGQINQDRLGWSVSGAGDVDADGTLDLVLGAPGGDVPEVDAGSAFVVSGADWSTLHRFNGPGFGAQLGTSVAGAGDVNADDKADVIIGSPFADAGGQNRGDARVYSGDGGTLLRLFIGDGPGHLTGWSVAGVGDATGDGLADVVIGSVFDDVSGPFSGSARVFAGTAYQRHDAATDLSGSAVGAQLGTDVSSAGDVDGDGTADLIVGATADSTLGRTGNGSATLYSGADLSVLFSFEGDASGDGLGIGVAAAGDVNNDGRLDLIVGANGDDTGGQDAGMARVYSGLDGSTLRTFRGAAAGDNMGFAVAGIGDINGDGHDDVLVGSPQPSAGNGFVQAFSGIDGAQLYRVDGTAARDLFGRAVARIADIDGDTVDDFVIGAPQLLGTPPQGAGFARVCSGIDGSTLYTFTGDATGDLFGWAVGDAGDFDGDGVSDIVVGAPGGDRTGGASGYVRIYSGLNGSVARDNAGVNAGDQFGHSVAGVGDADGDGLEDVIIGAIGVDIAAIDSGAAYLISSAYVMPLQRFDGDAQGDLYGWAGTGAGDLDGDGFPEIVIGVRFANGTGGMDSGVARVLSSVARTFPGRSWDYGSGCTTSVSTLPRISSEGRPAVGMTLQQKLATATPNAAVFLIVDVFSVSIDLTINGMPGCKLLTLPTLVVPTVADVTGSATVPLAIPGNPALVNAPVFSQWIVFDPAANPGQLVFSDGHAVQLGNP